MRKRPRTLLFALLGVFFLPGMAGAAEALQDPSDFRRLSGDQRKLADQARRLEGLLELLEQRERAEGNESRADLLSGARQRLRGSESTRDLISAIESVASDLGDLRAGSALEVQAVIIRQLEEMLDYLLDRQRMEQMEKLLDEAKARRKALDSLTKQQAELLKETGKLRQEEQKQSAADAERRSELSAAQSGLNEEIRQFAKQDQARRGSSKDAEEAARHGEQAAKALDPKTAAESREPGEKEAGDSEGEESGEEDGSDPEDENAEGENTDGERTGNQESGQQESRQRESGREQSAQQPGERLDEAQEEQEQALEALENALDQARKEVQELKDIERKEALLDLMNEASRLLERHLQVLDPLTQFAAENTGERVPRSARVQMRRWAEEEAFIATGTANLLLEVRESGADSVPFLLSTVKEDHERLSIQIGSPNYLAGEDQVVLGERLVQLWQDLITALRIEAERDRQKFQSQNDGLEGEQEEEEPLVSLAAEVQLLKRLEEHLRDRMQAMINRRGFLARAGIEPGDDDREEIDRIIERQTRLRSIFDGIVKRLESPAKPDLEEDA